MSDSAISPTASPPPEVTVRTSEPPRLRPVARLREMSASREILGNLIRKEVKVKYKSSVLGAAWSMLNPMLYLAVFSLVFAVVLPAPIPNFPVYLLSGILAWNLFATALGLASRSVVDNANLVTKVYFPREMLPLASLGSASVDLVLQGLVLGLFMVATLSFVLGWNLALLPLSLATLLVFTAALALLVGALNVRYRDTQHLLTVTLLAWFWITPVVYSSGLVYTKLAGKSFLGIPLWNLYLANPMADVVMGFQRALYGTVVAGSPPQLVLAPVSIGWLAMLLTAVLAASLILMWLCWRAFFRLAGDFAEEL